MPYNIEFQIAGLVSITVFILVFFSKERWSSLQNTIYKLILFSTFIELMFDIISVITITNRDKYPFLNEIFSYGYLYAMVAYIFLIDLYTVSNTLYDGMPKWRKRITFFGFIFIGLITGAALLNIMTHKLLYSGSGKFVYSYGIPSDTVYIYSTISVVLVIVYLLLYAKQIPLTKQAAIYSFCIMEGIVAITQMFNKELLIIGFGTAITVEIIYFTLENPDMKMINALDNANKRSKDLLLNILPETIADRLQENNSTFTEKFHDISILFLDIVNFSKMSTTIGAERLVIILNSFFSQIDALLENYRIEKIKTIGDAYMAAAGVPVYYEDNCEEMIRFARDILWLLEEFNTKNKTHIQVRIGIGNGDVVAGIIGKKKFIYDLWGESVNLASRMESYGKPGRINLSPSAYEKVKAIYTAEEQKNVDVKGFGKMSTFMLN